MTDLEIAANECAAELQKNFPHAPIDQLLALAFAEGSLHGFDRAHAAWLAGGAIGKAKRNAT